MSHTTRGVDDYISKMNIPLQQTVQEETELDRHMSYEITMLDTNLDTCIGQCYQSLEVSTNDNQVTWKNIDSIFHTVAVTVPDVDGYYSFTNLFADETFSRYFTKKATFDFECTIHPWLYGSFVVKDKDDTNIIKQNVENIPESITLDKNEIIARYAGFSKDTISDKEFLESFGVNAEHAPKYLDDIAVYLYQDKITEKEFETLLSYMVEKQIIK